MTKRLEHLGRRLEEDPYFLASLLRAYTTSEGLTDTQLADVLGCTMETLTQTRLCRAPREASFAADVDRIATRFGLERAALIQAVRRGQVLLKLRGASGARGVAGFLAARDGKHARDEAAPEQGP
jgi:AraC-like DNA-binding protein